MKKFVLLLSAALTFSTVSVGATGLTGQTVQQSGEEQNNETRVVVNEDFLRYFSENRIRQDENGNELKGKVVAEFRVNANGVPSAIQVVSGFSHTANRNVIDLLVKGPKWEPTGDERIRIVVEYEQKETEK